MTRIDAGRAAAFLGFLFFVVAGCGKEPGGRPQVQGHVLFKGSPVGGKTLNLRSEGGTGEFFSQRIPIRADGSFAGEVPVPGKYTIIIEESLAVQEGRQSADLKTPSYPAKYKDAATSDLVWTITKGENKKEIELNE
jgi:hypothetical protein